MSLRASKCIGKVKTAGSSCFASSMVPLNSDTAATEGSSCSTRSLVRAAMNSGDGLSTAVSELSIASMHQRHAHYSSEKHVNMICKELDLVMN